MLIYWYSRYSWYRPVQYNNNNNQAREGTQNQHKTQQVQQACFHRPKKFIFSNWRKENKYLPADGQELTETCRRIFSTYNQYNCFNVLFLIK